MDHKITASHEPLTGDINQSPSAFAKLTPRTDELLQGKSILQSPLAVAPGSIGAVQAPQPTGPLKVAIIGTAPSSRDLAPYNDPSWEIWGTSPGNAGILPRVTRWLEIHCNLMWPECKSYGEPYLKWLNEQTFPIYMQDQSFVPRAIAFPRASLLAKYGPYFFTSSFAWGMALAMEMGAVEIGLYGVDMASKEEYIKQRPGGHYFMQRARERGITVTIPPESDLEQPPPLYGYDQASRFGRKLAARTSEIDQRLASMNSQKVELEKAIAYLGGAKEDVGYVADIWGGLGA